MPGTIKQPFLFGHFFFSLNGRVTRVPFSVFILPSKIFFWGAPVVIRAYPLDKSLLLPLVAVISILHISILWPIFAVTFKRLHDIGLSGLLGLLAFIPPVMNMIVSGLTARATLNGLSNPTPIWIGTMINMLFYIIWACTLALAFWPSCKGSNTYGPDPSQPEDTSEVF